MCVHLSQNCLCRVRRMFFFFRFVFSCYSKNIFLSMTRNKPRGSHCSKTVNLYHLCFLLPHLLKSKFFNFMLLSSAYTFRYFWGKTVSAIVLISQTHTHILLERKKEINQHIFHFINTVQSIACAFKASLLKPHR